MRASALEAFIAKAVLPPTAPVLDTAVQFTPLVGLAGGAVLGLSVVGKYLITGRILGISGGIKGWLTGDWKSWRVAFNGGLLLGAVIAGVITPGAFDVLPASFTVERAALGGLLVGLGASLGNGCTSGHGICGNARLSFRSLAFTLLFMGSGALAATLSGSALALGIKQQAAPLVWSPSDVVLNQGTLLLAAACISVAGMGALAQQVQASSKKAVALLTELVCGCLFAFGLVYTGMVRPTKVAAFLSPASASWDPTLMFVMGGALAVALPVFQYVKRGKTAPPKPLCADKFLEPPSSVVDARLAAGGVMFGAGWGLSGMCPGPALVALVATLNPPAQVVAYCSGMLLGMALDCVASGKLRLLPPPKPAAA